MSGEGVPGTPIYQPINPLLRVGAGFGGARSSEHLGHVRLIHRFDEHFVDIDVGWTRGYPNQDLRNVGGEERVGAGVRRFRFLGVAFEADE